MVNLAFEGSEVLITSENIFCRWGQFEMRTAQFQIPYKCTAYQLQ